MFEWTMCSAPLDLAEMPGPAGGGAGICDHLSGKWQVGKRRVTMTVIAAQYQPAISPLATSP